MEQGKVKTQWKAKVENTVDLFTKNLDVALYEKFNHDATKGKARERIRINIYTIHTRIRLRAVPPYKIFCPNLIIYLQFLTCGGVFVLHVQQPCFHKFRL